MEYLIALIGLLLGGFMYQRNRANTAEARNENLEVKEKLNDISKEEAKNNGLLEAEEAKRNKLNEELKNVQKHSDNLNDLSNSINKL